MKQREENKLALNLDVFIKKGARCSEPWWEVYCPCRIQLAGGTESFTRNSRYFSPLFFCEGYTAIDIYASYKNVRS